jgi:DNA-binding XRE family transcriptional regulator
MQALTKKPPTKRSGGFTVTISQGGKTASIINIPANASTAVRKMLESVGEPTIPYEQTSLAAEFGQGQGGVPAAVMRGLRERDGLTQTQLGERLGMSAGHVSDHERGKRSISLRLARKLAVVFGTDYHLFC